MLRKGFTKNKKQRIIKQVGTENPQPEFSYLLFFLEKYPFSRLLFI